MNIKTICLVGPTGSGKTSLAFGLVKSMRGEIVNLDKIYAYKRFLLGTGLSDNEKQSTIKRHLYCLIEPNEDIIPPVDFAGMVRRVCCEINQRGRVAIIEGGSTTYFPALCVENERDPFIQQIVGLYFPSNFDVAKNIEGRIDAIIGGGLLDEVKMGMKKYPESLIMRDCHFIVPMVRYLNGEISLSDAKKEVVRRNLQYVEKQMRCFRAYPNIKWVEYGKKISGRIDVPYERSSWDPS